MKKQAPQTKNIASKNFSFRRRCPDKEPTRGAIVMALSQMNFAERGPLFVSFSNSCDYIRAANKTGCRFGPVICGNLTVWAQTKIRGVAPNRKAAIAKVKNFDYAA